MSLTFSYGDGGINLGNRIHEEFKTVLGYVYKGLFSTESFTNSDMVHVPRTENIKADRLARSVRKQPSFVIHMDAELPPSFTEST
ncbi:hypothetical protein Bca101_051304 [Brassica carinata]